MGSVRLEESGEWSGGVPECRTAHAAHQQCVESGRTPAQDLTASFQGREKNFPPQGFGCPSSFQDILFSHCPVWVILREIFEKILCG